MTEIGSDFPRRITKFVPAAVYDLVLSGSLKFGALAEYRACEASESRLTDSSDGATSHYVKRDLRGESFTLGGDIFLNLTTSGCGKAVVVEESQDALVFCASCGNYSSDRHRQFIAAGNESCTHYVVFDVDAFVQATQKLSRLTAPRGWGAAARVIYAEKDHEVSLRDIERIANRKVTNERDRRARIIRSIYTKAPRFRYEDEFRVSLMRIHGNPATFKQALMTANAPGSIRTSFKNAILDGGKI